MQKQLPRHQPQHQPPMLRKSNESRAAGVTKHECHNAALWLELVCVNVSDILPRLKRRGLPLARASSRFSFEQSTDYSISELTPCAPRFYWLWLCENDSHSFISDIDCSVYVSVVMCATFRAIPCSYAEILCFCVFVSTA